MYDYLIVGAGLFGATFAQQAKMHKKKCLVIDKRDHIAGNAHTSVDKKSGVLMHRYGAHIFHTSDPIIWDYVNQFCKFNNFINSPIAIYDGKAFNLPFNMNTFNKLWGVTTPDQARAYIKNQVDAFGVEYPSNLEEHAISLVGPDIYHKLIKGYTEKQWGRFCRDLPADIIKRIPLRFNYDNNYFNDDHQGIPVGGYTKMVENMLKGIKVELNTDYFELIKSNPKIAKKIVYTGMIDKYFNYCYGRLEYRSLNFEDKVIMKNDNFQGVAVTNHTERHIPYTRIIEHRHFSKDDHENCPNTVLSYEYPVEYEKGMEPFYPINDKENNGKATFYQYLSRDNKNTIFGGRLAEYKYYDMDKVIARALIAVKTEFDVMVWND